MNAESNLFGTLLMIVLFISSRLSFILFMTTMESLHSLLASEKLSSLNAVRHFHHALLG